MLNQTVLVGRLTTDPEVHTSENGTEYSNITLAVPRSYKNAEGEYETDFVKCSLFGNVAKSTADYCKKGDLVGVRGSLLADNKNNLLSVRADRITFLSSENKLKKENIEMY